MSTIEIVVPFKRGTTSQNDAYKGLSGELTIDVTRTTVRVHDGLKAGGNELLTRGMLENVDEQVETAVASAAAAAASAAAAGTSAGQANTSKNAASASATAAGLAQTGAAASATTATQQATIATERATVATNAATTAVAAQTATVALLDSFRSVYLGEFATDPTTDSHGNPILDGAEYRNTVTKKIRVYRTPPGIWRDYTDDEEAALLNAQLSAAAASASAGAALTSEQHAAQSEVAADAAKTSATASEAAATAAKNASAVNAAHAATSEENTAASEAAALAAKNTAVAAANSATLSEAAALAAKSAAAASQDSASGSALGASTSLTKAQAWAAAPEDQVVETGLYSSLHYAAKALEQADRAQSISDAVEEANIDAVAVHNDRLHVDEVMIDVAAAAAAADSSKTAAATSATNAGSAKTAAETAKTAAENAKTAAETARSGAESARDTATVNATTASNAADASIAARNASAISASNAAASEANAADAQDTALAARDGAVGALTEFKTHWFGPLSSAPGLKPNGNALQSGDYYWDLTANVMKVYNGTAWLNPLATQANQVAVSPAGVIISTNVQAALGELGTAAKLNAGTSAANVIKGDDERLTNARPISLSAMAGQVPVWNGTAWVAGAIVPGLTYFTETRSTSGVNGSVYVSQLVPVATTTNADLAIVPKGAGALLAQTPDGTATGGNKRGNYATDWQRARTLNSQVASGNYATLSGGQNNIASGAHSAVAGGLTNKASGDYSICAGGNENQVAGANSASLGGSGNVLSAPGSVALGGVYGSDRNVQGAVVSAGLVSSASGQRQHVEYLLTGLPGSGQTISLTTDGLSYDMTQPSKNTLVIPPNSCFMLTVRAIAQNLSPFSPGARIFSGTVMVVSGATASTTSVVSSNVAAIQTNGNTSVAVPVFSADTVSGALRVNVTGISGQDTRWLCHIDALELSV